MCFGSTLLHVKSVSLRNASSFALNEYSSPYRFHSVEFDDCVMKQYLCWDFVFAAVGSVLTEHTDRTPKKRPCDQKQKSEK